MKFGRLKRLSDKIKRLEQRIKRAELSIVSEQQSISVQSRKERTRNLIQKGALAEKYFNLEDTSVKDTEKLFAAVSEFIKSKKGSIL